MTEPVNEHDLQAYADGELPEERRAAVAAWLAAHPEDAERIENYRHLAEELRSTYEGVLAEPVPEHLERALRPEQHAALRRGCSVGRNRGQRSAPSPAGSCTACSA